MVARAAKPKPKPKPKLRVMKAMKPKPKPKLKVKKAGLKGVAAPSDTSVVDNGLAKHNAALASHVQVIAGLDARLVLIEPAKNNDKYYILQGLEDTKLTLKSEKRCYAYQRWGRTGTGGQCKLMGPVDHPKVKAELAKVFRSKTGAAWGTLDPGAPVKAGKYWLQKSSKPDPTATWEYYVGDGVDGKRTGWYPYDRDASVEVEDIYAQHAANKGGRMSTHTRVVSSGNWMYRVDLDAMEQTNTTTKKLRKIRRVKT